MAPALSERLSRNRLTIALGGAAAAVGVILAISRAWSCDDAFISFRYARNLVEGHGLVFNAGERVEGYTNFLWTLWCSVGLRLGFEAPRWANAWSILLYAGSILLLVLHHVRLRGAVGERASAVPVAALFAAAHFDWTVYATSGLETSAVTTLALAGYLLLASPGARMRPGAAGGVLGLAALTRPDALLLALLGGAYTIGFGSPRARSAARFAAAFLLVWLPATIWRVSYYGDFFPNTYYAKSAYLTWWSQGLRYAETFFQQYWTLGAGLLLVVAAAILRLSRGERPVLSLPRSIALAAAFALTHTLWVARVGGDFMYARMLIPTVPFFALLIDLGLAQFRWRTPVAWGVAAVLVAALALSRSPVTEGRWKYGIANEWMYYRDAKLDEQYVHTGEVLRRYLSDLPARVAFLGSEARLVYEGRVPEAIEAETGLTDPVIARQELTERGRIGHEKAASIPYLISERKVHLAFHSAAPRVLQIERYVPLLEIQLDDVRGWLLHWDPDLVRELRARGAKVDDFPSRLDQALARLDRLEPGQVRALYERLSLFYFDHVEDAEREALFARRLSTDSSSPPPAGPR